VAFKVEANQNWGDWPKIGGVTGVDPSGGEKVSSIGLFRRLIERSSLF
jgi:hypothetical protein